jgi:hypothetical protein
MFDITLQSLDSYIKYAMILHGPSLIGWALFSLQKYAPRHPFVFLTAKYILTLFVLGSGMYGR